MASIWNYLENMYIESVLKKQRDIFHEINKEKIEHFRGAPRTLQETENYFQEYESEFRQWFITNYIIPKYFS